MTMYETLLFTVVSVLALVSRYERVEALDGRLFLLAYMDPSVGVPNANGFQEIHISGLKEDGRVRFAIPSLNRTKIITLDSSNKWRQTINVYEDLAGPVGTKLPVTIYIASEVNISVQTNKAEDKTGDGYLVLPITRGSKEFYLAAYTPRDPVSAAAVATIKDSCIQVRYQNGAVDQREIYLTLPANNSYRFNVSGSDWTGLYVTASNPIAVYSGLDCAYIPEDQSQVTSCDHIIEQMPNKASYGRTFIMSSFYGIHPSVGYQFRVIFLRATTLQITRINANTGAVLGTETIPSGPPTNVRGQFYEGHSGRGLSHATITILKCTTGVPSEEKCLVMQYSPGNDATRSGTETNKPDAFMITVPALTQYTSDITFSTSKYYVAASNSSAEFINGITIVARKGDVTTINFDESTPISSMSGVESTDITDAALNSETFTVLRAPLTPGFHTIVSSNPTVNFTAFVYGHAPSSAPGNTGYGYLAGFRFNPNDAPIVAGPWFNFDAPQEPNGEPTSDPGDVTPAPPLTPADIPAYEVVFEAKFYTLEPTVADLKTKNCSEAYFRYYMEYRFSPMKQRLLDSFVPRNCGPNIDVNMTQLLYYSQFTDGLLRFQLSLRGSGTVTLREVLTCIGLTSDYVSEYRNWYAGYQGVTDFLKNDDVYYVRGCDTLHMGSPSFNSYYFGWVCPSYGGVVGASGVGNLLPSFVVITISSAFAFLLFRF